jgi:hypothetical protein
VNLFRQQLAGHRLAAGTKAKGRWVEGAASDISFEASVQPIQAHELKFLEIGRRERKSYVLYTDFKLNALTSGTINPDRVFINGEEFEVVVEAPWRNNVINHYKYIVQFLNAVEA